MKNRIWISLPLAVALLAPAFARQDSSTQNAPQNAPAASSSDQTAPAGSQTSANATPTGHEPLQAERHEGFWGKINPLARKKYVQRQMEPIRNRVNELDELTASNSKSIKDVDARAQEGISRAAARANEADQHALDAGNRAQTADQTAQQANTRLQNVSQVVSNIDQYQKVTDTEIRLRPGQSALSKKAKEALDQMAESVKGQKAYMFEVQGFSSGHGAAAIENSQRMAQSVVRYLVVSHEIPVYRIHLLGLGNATLPTADGSKPKRVTGGRVEVSLLKNTQLEQLAGVSPLQMPGSATGGNASSQGGATGATVQSAPRQNTTTTPTTQQPASNEGAPDNSPR